MTNEEILELCLAIKAKSYVNDNDKTNIWKAYETLYGQYIGNKNCQECQREAVRKMLNQLS